MLISKELLDHYSDSLINYLGQPGESGLLGAQRFGRKALSHGLGLPDMAAIHHELLRLLLVCSLADGTPAEAGSRSRLGRLRDLSRFFRELMPEESTAALKAAGYFFTESIAAFETSHRQSQDAAAAMNERNRRLEEQAGRIAHAIYDETLQLLASVNLVLDQIAARLPACGREFSECSQFLDLIRGQLTRFSHDLRPAILDDIGLDAAIELLADRCARTAGIEIAVKTVSLRPLSYSLATVLFRAVQEALTNISAHARGTRASIRLKQTGGAITCSIRDNGIGFDAPEIFSARGGRGLGLIGIRETVGACGGTLAVESSPGKGTEILISVPWTC